MTQKSYEVVGMHCFSCSSGIQKLLKRNKAVADVAVKLSESKIIVSFKDDVLDDQTVIDTVGRLGYKAVPIEK